MDVLRNPAVMYQPWLARLFPGVTLEQLAAGYWTLGTYVGMAAMARDGA